MQEARNITMMGRTKPRYGGLTFTAEEPTTIALVKQGSTAPAVTLEQSFDGKTWTPFSGSVTLAANESVFLRAGAVDNTQFSTGPQAYNHFTATGRVAASGSIMSLLSKDYETVEMTTTYTFAYLFDSCSNLTSAPDLPATTLSIGCYRRMFYSCTLLASTPVLPATTLANLCYHSMFQDCTSLITAPKLPATTLAASCYNSMFNGCTSLTIPPPTLPATALTGTSTYQQMFNGCLNMEKAPVICLTTTPSKNNQMRFMFDGCRKLKEIEIHITSWPSSTTTMGYWVSGVASTGTFKCPAALGTNDTINRGISNCPAGWTVVNV